MVKMWELKKEYNKKEQEILERGDRLSNNGHFTAARDLYQRMLKENPKDENILLKIANTYFIEQDFDTAEKKAEEALKANSKYLKTLALLGQIAASKEDKDKMEKHFEKAYKISKNDSNVIASHGKAYIFLGDENRSFELFSDALRLDPKTLEAWVGITYALFYSDKVDQVEDFVDEMLKKNKDSPTIFALKAMTYSIRNETEKALELYEQVKEMEPELSLPWGLLAENCLLALILALATGFNNIASLYKCKPDFLKANFVKVTKSL